MFEFNELSIEKNYGIKKKKSSATFYLHKIFTENRFEIKVTLIWDAKITNLGCNKSKK